jgi:hypothetical protein
MRVNIFALPRARKLGDGHATHAASLLPTPNRNGSTTSTRRGDREQKSHIAVAVMVAAVAGGVATAWVPPIPRHGGNIEFLRFALRWLLAVAVLGVPAALSAAVADHLLSRPLGALFGRR